MYCKYLSVTFLYLIATVRSQLFQQEVYDYCDPKLKLCEVFTDHTMCKYPISGLSSECTPDIHEPLNATEKKKILFWHNKFRSNVANGVDKTKSRKLPTSSNMRKIYWDRELEAIAERWAEQCASTTAATPYDKCRNTKRFQVSQNVGTRRVNGTTIDKQAPQIVITWYKESKDFDPALVDKFEPVGEDKMSIKQFANLISGDTYAVGCARVIFQERLLNAKDSKYYVSTTERLVCNYGPGGNEIGKPIYKRGVPCENCPNGTQCSRALPGLCALLNEDKLLGQQNLENQDPKDDVKTETEIPILQPETTSGSSVTEETSKDSDVEEQQTNKMPSPTLPEKKKKVEKEEEKCEGRECMRTTPKTQRTTPMDPIRRFDEIIRFGRPTARKKSREVGLAVPNQRNDNNLEKRKWIVSNGKKVKRDEPQQQKLKNGDACKCFMEVEDESGGSSRAHKNIFLLFFSGFVAVVEPFLYYASSCKQ